MWRDDLVSALRVACTHDDAVDWSRVDCVAYSGNTATPGDRDPARVEQAALPGRAITWFHLRPISAPVFATWIEDSRSEEQRWIRCFQAAVASIENLEPGGPPWSGTVPQPEPATGGIVHIISESELEHVRRILGIPWVYEVGKIAYQRAAEGNTRGGGVRYTLPPTSLVALSLNVHRRAEYLRTTQEAKNKEQSSDSSATTQDAA